MHLTNRLDAAQPQKSVVQSGLVNARRLAGRYAYTTMKPVFTLILAFVVTSCDVQLNAAHRSGTLNDDYVAEAPPDKYHNLLESTVLTAKPLRALPAPAGDVTW